MRPPFFSRFKCDAPTTRRARAARASSYHADSAGFSFPDPDICAPLYRLNSGARREQRALLVYACVELERELRQNTKTSRSDKYRLIVRRWIKESRPRNQPSDAGRSGPHLMACSSRRNLLIRCLMIDLHFSDLGVLVFCLAPLFSFSLLSCR